MRRPILVLLAGVVVAAVVGVALIARPGDQVPHVGLPPAPTTPPPTETAPPVPPPAPPQISDPCPTPGAPVAIADAKATLARLARTTVAAARRTAADGTPIFFPDGAGAYQAFWVRDFAYMADAGPSVVSDQDLDAGIRWLIARQRPQDGAMPDRVDPAGAAAFNVFGDRPPTDNPSFMVDLVYQQFRRSGSPALFQQVAVNLGRGMATVPRDATGLVTVDPAAPHSTYGFTDSVVKTGEELFTSILFARAARRMGDMWQAAGDDAQAAAWRAEGDKTAAALGQLYDEPSGMFLAASADGRVIDVWGSAFAVASGVVADARADRIATWLHDHFASISYQGQIRHLPAGTSWPKLFDPRLAGTYQDGGYWATASGWVAAAIARIDRPAAQELLAETARGLTASGGREFVAPGPSGCKLGAAQYAASATLPYTAAQQLLP